MFCHVVDVYPEDIAIAKHATVSQDEVARQLTFAALAKKSIKQPTLFKKHDVTAQVESEFNSEKG